jgi:sugar phosphate isomerase/epimerase
MLETRKFPLIQFGMAMSPRPAAFAPLLYAGRLEEGLKALAEAGFAGVEISLSDVEELDAQWLTDRLGTYGLKVSAFASGRMCLEKSLCLCNPEPEARKKALEVLTAILKLAARFQAPLIIGGVRGKLTGDEDQKARQRATAVDTMRRCSLIAQDLGIHLLLEPINRYETNFINTAQDGLSLLEEIGQPAFKLLLDTFHMNIEESNLNATLKGAGQQLRYVHFADNNRLAPGRGHIDFPALMQTLSRINYNGFISAEILPIPDDATALKQTGKYLHTLLITGKEKTT